MANITVVDKEAGDLHYADELDEQVNFINQPAKAGTTFTDTGTITTDETIEYSTIRTVTGSTHTLTAATTGNLRGNYKKARYTFDVDCNLTLTDFDNTGSTVGTVNPIPAGTYDLWFFTTPFGVALLIQNNTGTTPGTLSTPTLVLSVGNGQLGYTITGIDANATAGVLEYSTNNIDFTTWGSYSFGTETGSITGLTNGVLYYVQYRNSASGYTASEYATDTSTPTSGYTFLNLYELNISGVGDGVKVTNDNMYPSGAYSFEIWGTTPAALSFTGACIRMLDDDDDFILTDIQIGGSTNQISTTFRTDASNRMVKAYGRVAGGGNPLSVSTKYHIVITKGIDDDYASTKIYLNNVEPPSSGYEDDTVGTYAGIRSLVGNVVLEVPRSNLASFLETIQGFRVFNSELSSSEVTELYNSGNMVGLSSSLQAKCVQENLLNNNANADNIGNNGTTEGSATYSLI